MKTLKGFDVVRGVIKEKALYASRKDAARHVEASAKGKGTRGFITFDDEVVEVLSVIRGGKWCHQEVGGKGRTRHSYTPSVATYQGAYTAVVADLKRKIRANKELANLYSKRLNRAVAARHAK